MFGVGRSQKTTRQSSFIFKSLIFDLFVMFKRILPFFLPIFYKRPQKPNQHESLVEGKKKKDKR